MEILPFIENFMEPLNIIFKPVNPAKVNPFHQHPELKSIWLPELAEIARQAYEEEAQALKHDPNYPSGEAFLIYHEIGKNKKKQKLIGITGYFSLDTEYTRFSLRWHGLFPDYQGKGISQTVIKTMCERIQSLYPQSESIMEFMPIIPEYEKTAQYFTKLGFVKKGSPEDVDWSTYQWQGYVLEFPKKDLKLKIK